MKIVNCRTLSALSEFMLDGEPCFVIRAQDKCSVEALCKYLEIIQAVGGKNQIRTKEDIMRFTKWQDENPHRVKLPD